MYYNLELILIGIFSCFISNSYAGFPQSWKILENPGKKSGHGKVMENSKNSECHGN